MALTANYELIKAIAIVQMFLVRQSGGWLSKLDS